MPHPSDAMQIYMQSDREEIEVFLCEDPPDDETGSSPRHANSPSKQGTFSYQQIRFKIQNYLSKYYFVTVH